jgi:hypothetical protein
VDLTCVNSREKTIIMLGIPGKSENMAKGRGKEFELGSGEGNWCVRFGKHRRRCFKATFHFGVVYT